MRAVLASFALLVAFGSAGAADPSTMVRLVPTPVNSVAMVNVGLLLTTPRAQKEGWTKLDHTEYLAGAVPVHPSIERILFAKELHPGSPTRGNTVAIVPLKKDANLKKFAAAFRGEMTTIADADVVMTPNGAFTAALDPRTLGSIITENRQEVGRWLKYVRTKPTQSQQSNYMVKALAADGAKHHVVVIVDTEDLFGDKQAALLVGLSQVLVGKLKESQAIEEFLKGLQGVRLFANVTADGITADLQFDGKAKPKVDPLILKPFLIETFNRNGAHLADLPAASVKITDGNAVKFTFQITDGELANIMALFLPPHVGHSEHDDISINPVDGKPTGSATGRYFRTVGKILDDLKQQNKRATQFQATALWHETAAQRIETLSVIGVDTIAVEFAHGTGARLRAIADSLRGQAVTTAMLESKAYVVTYVPPPISWGPYGLRYDLNPSIFGRQTQTNLAEVQRAIQETAIRDAESRNKLWDTMERQRSEVNNALTRKYSGDFAAPGK